MSTIREFKVQGMTCDNCARHVQKALLSVAGVSSAKVDLAAGSSEVELDTEAIDVQAMQKAVKDAGYELAV